MKSGRLQLNRGVLALSAILVCIQITPVLADFNHEGFFGGGYNGSATCKMCHGEMVGEVMNSVHYQWRSENPLVEFPGGGAHGMIDRACGLVGSNAIVNYYEHCGRCHVGNSHPFPDPQTGQYSAAQKDNIDCLICHAAEGMYDTNNDGVGELGEIADNKPLVLDEASGNMMWHQDRRIEAAESVGGRVSVEACLRCHHHGQADYQYKRGTPFEHDTDVHAAAGLHCTDCHTVDHHKIARGSRVTDMFAWERQDVDVKCENCHGDAPHTSMPALNNHIEYIGCETCHIPEVAGAHRRVWAPTLGVTEGPESQVPVFDQASGKWLPYSSYDQGLTSPSYRWFAGGASMLAEPIASPGAFNMQPATRETPGARILPFRHFVSGQPMDGMGIPGMPGFDANFTMGAALTQMSPMLKMTGFMRPEGMTPQEEAMMSQFPNMLIFDRADYFANGDVAAAVSIGMAKQGAFMQGMNTQGMSRDDLIAMGSQMWSGQVAGLDLPNNPYAPGYVDDQDPTTVTGSFITLSHAVKKDGALSCMDCHTENGRLDFALLGYSVERQQELTDPQMIHATAISEYKGPQTCLTCHQKQGEDMFHSVHYQWSGPTPNVPNIDGTAGKGEDGYNTYCGAVNASRKIVCWGCHVGTGKVPEKEMSQAQLRNIDCLICHQDGYKRKPAPTIPTGDINGDFVVDFADFSSLATKWLNIDCETTGDCSGADLDFDGVVSDADMLPFSKNWLNRGGAGPVTYSDFDGVEHTWKLPKEDRFRNVRFVPDADAMSITMLEAARTVHMPTRASCLQCHATAGGGNGLKRGDIAMASVNPPREKDVHMSGDGGDLTCQSCHKTENHRMLGRGLDLRPNDRPESMDCTICHKGEVHAMDRLNKHMERVACQTCHIPMYGKLAPTEVERDWSKPHWVQGVYRGQGGYKPTEITQADLTPTYAWYDGTSYVYKLGQIAPMNAAGQYELAAPNGSVNSAGAKIYPMKEHITDAAMHDATSQMIPYSTTKYFHTGRFDLAVEDGLAERGLTGDWSRVTTHTFQTLNHGVEPKENALICGDCHASLGTGENLRMDLQGEMGYELKAPASQLCSTCHGFEHSEGFLDTHHEHSRFGCASCHNFSR